MSAEASDETFKCCWCGVVFKKAITDEEAMAESTVIFGEAAMKEELDVVCDDCWVRFMARRLT